MVLTANDRLAIHEVIALHGHLSDAGAYERFDEVFTSDLRVDATDLGLAPPREMRQLADPSRSLDAFIAAGRRRGPGSTIAMHATNVIVRADGEGARVWSKGFTVDISGFCASFTYEDQLVQTKDGWRIKHRIVSARREPGRGVEPCP